MNDANPQRCPSIPSPTRSSARRISALSASRCWGTYPRSLVTVMLPRVSGTWPKSRRSSEVFPEPLGPSTAMNSPGSTVRSKPCQRVRPPRFSDASRSVAALMRSLSATGLRARGSSQGRGELFGGASLPGDVVGAFGQRFGDRNHRNAV
ncbi:Uncharacterised protein [Mycobacteroides abscessus subsp. abscessus]|nr:Uncharacterised protein [Mycobacteroides abscessus subsp. abscessus]